MLDAWAYLTIKWLFFFAFRTWKKPLMRWSPVFVSVHCYLSLIHSNLLWSPRPRTGSMPMASTSMRSVQKKWTKYWTSLRTCRNVWTGQWKIWMMSDLRWQHWWRYASRKWRLTWWSHQLKSPIQCWTSTTSSLMMAMQSVLINSLMDGSFSSRRLVLFISQLTPKSNLPLFKNLYHGSSGFTCLAFLPCLCATIPVQKRKIHSFIHSLDHVLTTVPLSSTLIYWSMKYCLLL